MINISKTKKCPYCKKKINIFCEQVIQDGEEMDGMNSEITIEEGEDNNGN